MALLAIFNTIYINLTNERQCDVQDNYLSSTMYIIIDIKQCISFMYSVMITANMIDMYILYALISRVNKYCRGLIVISCCNLEPSSRWVIK